MGLHPKVEEFAKKIPQSIRSCYVKAMEGNSRAAAMKAFCQQCVGFSNWANEIRGCTAQTCPLYPQRPYQHSDDEEQDEMSTEETSLDSQVA